MATPVTLETAKMVSPVLEDIAKTQMVLISGYEPESPGLGVVLILIALCFLLWGLTTLLQRVEPKHEKGFLPEAPSFPLIGNLTLLRGLPHVAVTKMARMYGKIFRLNAGGDRSFVIFNDIDSVQEAMRKFPTAMSGKPTSTTTQMTGSNGAHQDQGKRWRRRRQLTMAACKSFFRETSLTIRGICQQELETLVQCLAEKSDNNGYDPHHDITFFVAKTMFRLTYGQGDEVSPEICERLHDIANSIDDYTRNAGPFSKLDRFPFLRRLYNSALEKYRVANSLFRSLCETGLRTRRESSRQRGEAHADLMSFFQQRAACLTQNDNGKLGLTEDILLGGLEDLLRAGIESPSLILQWVLLCLAKHPQIQERLAAEVTQYAKQEQQTVLCEDDLDSLPYCQAVIYETVRYCSLIPFLKRKTLDEVTVGSHAIPKGTTIIINNHAINQDTAKWDHPEDFRPERFLDEDGSFNKKMLERFLPFGIGRRRCMGEELGKMLPFSALATLIYHFRCSAAPGAQINLKPSFGITLLPQPQPISLRMRSSQNTKDQLVESSCSANV